VKAKTCTRRNVTLSLPIELIEEITVLAAQREISISALLQAQFEKLLLEQKERLAATNRLKEIMDTAPNRGVMGNVTWKREDLYDRHERWLFKPNILD
jgi:hypothetical protein